MNLLLGPNGEEKQFEELRALSYMKRKKDLQLEREKRLKADRADAKRKMELAKSKSEVVADDCQNKKRESIQADINNHVNQSQVMIPSISVGSKVCIKIIMLFLQCNCRILRLLVKI